MYKTPQYLLSICLFFICFSSMSQAETPENPELLAQCDFNHNGVIDGRTMVKKGETTKEQAKLESGCSMDIIRKENAEGEKEIAEGEKRIAKLTEDRIKLVEIIKSIESTTQTTSGKNK